MLSRTSSKQFTQPTLQIARRRFSFLAAQAFASQMFSTNDAKLRDGIALMHNAMIIDHFSKQQDEVLCHTFRCLD